jgi:hypothetical protein
MANSGVATMIVTFLFAHRVYKIFDVRIQGELFFVFHVYSEEE